MDLQNLRLVYTGDLEDAPREIQLNKDLVVVGRDPSAVDVVVDSAKQCGMTSRVHARFVRSRKADGTLEWIMEDMNTTNGCLVNFVKIANSSIRPGDVIHFGGSTRARAPVPVGQRVPVPVSRFSYRVEPVPSIDGDSSSPNSGGLKRLLESSEEEPPEKRRHVDSTDPAIKEMLEQKEKEVESLKREQEELLKRLEEEREQKEQKEREMKEREEESRRVEEELKRRAEDAERERSAALEESRREDAEKKEKLDVSTLAPEEFKEEATCPKCKDLFLHSVTLECGHSFCKSCLQDLVKTNKNCAICKRPIVSKPVRHKLTDNIVAKILDHSTEEERAAYNERVRRLQEREQKACAALRKHAEEAAAKGQGFLKIHDTWTDQDKEIFSKGVRNFRGKAKELFCSLAGLTKEAIQAAPFAVLVQFAANTRVPIADIAQDEEQIRKRLIDFVTDEFFINC